MVRILRAVDTGDLVRRFHELQASELSREVTRTTLAELPRLFGSPGAAGCQMAVRAAAPLEPGDILAASAAALTNDLLDELESRSPEMPRRPPAHGSTTGHSARRSPRRKRMTGT